MELAEPHAARGGPHGRVGGVVLTDGEAGVYERGVCWSTSPNPTIFDETLACGSGTGSFTCTVSGLQPGTTYYLRAYALSLAHGYCNEVSFTTAGGQIPALNGWGVVFLGFLLAAGLVLGGGRRRVKG